MTNVKLWVRHWDLFSKIKEQRAKMFQCSVQEAANMSDMELNQEWDQAAQALGLLEESQMVGRLLKSCNWTEEDSQAVKKIMQARKGEGLGITI